MVSFSVFNSFFSCCHPSTLHFVPFSNWTKWNETDNELRDFSIEHDNFHSKWIHVGISASQHICMGRSANSETTLCPSQRTIKCDALIYWVEKYQKQIKRKLILNWLRSELKLQNLLVKKVWVFRVFVHVFVFWGTKRNRFVLFACFLFTIFSWNRFARRKLNDSFLYSVPSTNWISFVSIGFRFEKYSIEPERIRKLGKKQTIQYFSPCAMKRWWKWGRFVDD